MRNLVTSFFNWLDDRTGYRQQMRETLYENIPSGSRWRYVTGSMLVFAFVTQVVTGLFLWMAYSPSSQTAWESVYYIQNVMNGGWMLRGIHHFMAQAMVILLPIHMLQVIVDRAYKAPREVNYWLGLILMLLVLGLGLTGYLLPWDQKGYWATKVATNLSSLPPGGAIVQKLVVGGPDYGHHTLTRFFALHAGVLPLLLVIVLGLHVTLFRRHGITPHITKGRPDEYFWPMQMMKDGVACLVLLILVLAAVYLVGAEMSAPADPSEEYAAARPEWYFLFLFQLLKKFKSEFFGAIVVPAVIVAYLFAMPLVAKLKFGHAVNLVMFFALFIGAGYLTVEAWYHDNYSTMVEKAEAAKDPITHERYKGSADFLQSSEIAHHEYQRMKELVEYYGIPKEGATSLARQDPEIQGPRLFVRHCASCHSFNGGEVHIAGPAPNKDGAPNGAPNLYGFASRQWLTGFFDPEKIVSHEFFGNTAHRYKRAEDGSENGGAKEDGRMVGFVKEKFSSLDDAGTKNLESLIIALSHEAKLAHQRQADEKDQAQIEMGRELFESEFACTDCHSLASEDGYVDGPNLGGYGSAQWLTQFINNPEHFYGATGNDRMPAFAAHEDVSKNQLSNHEIDMLVRWIRGDDNDLELKLAERSKQPAPAEKVETKE